MRRYYHLRGRADLRWRADVFRDIHLSWSDTHLRRQRQLRRVGYLSRLTDVSRIWRADLRRHSHMSLVPDL